MIILTRNCESKNKYNGKGEVGEGSDILFVFPQLNYIISLIFSYFICTLHKLNIKYTWKSIQKNKVFFFFKSIFVMIFIILLN